MHRGEPNRKMSKTTAIVLAAGQGKRMNAQVAKQYLILKDKPVVYYSLKAFEDSNVDEIILVTGNGQVDYCREQIVAFYQMNKVTKIIEGGKERYDSVYRAFKSIEETDYVLIHDGARPFITPNMINNMMQQVKIYEACIVGTPVKETIKVVNPAGIVIDTPNRDTLWSVQTPQAFAYASIRKAYDVLYKEEGMKSMTVTDDAMVYEAYIKHPIKMIMGDYKNLKLTTEEDLNVAKTWMEEMGDRTVM